MFSGNAFAAEAAAETSSALGMGCVAAALSTGMSCIGWLYRRTRAASAH